MIMLNLSDILTSDELIYVEQLLEDIDINKITRGDLFSILHEFFPVDIIDIIFQRLKDKNEII